MMGNKLFRTMAEAKATSDADLWTQFYGSLTPRCLIARYGGGGTWKEPPVEALHFALRDWLGLWVATWDIADYIVRRLWRYAQEQRAREDR